MNALKNAINELYSAFSRVPKPQQIDGCDCCADEHDLKRLLSYHVREIPPEVLSPYASSALLTVGSVDDYLFFIPRILEVHSIDDSFYPDSEITGRAIAETNVDNWPDTRRAALESFFVHTIRSALAPERHHLIDSWMCTIAKIGLPLKPALNDLQHSTDATLAYFTENASGLPSRKLSNPFWELPNTGHDEIVNWFYSPPIRKIVYDAYGYQLKPEHTTETDPKMEPSPKNEA